MYTSSLWGQFSGMGKLAFFPGFPSQPILQGFELGVACLASLDALVWALQTSHKSHLRHESADPPGEGNAHARAGGDEKGGGGRKGGATKSAEKKQVGWSMASLI